MQTKAIAFCLTLEMIGALSAAEPQSINAPASHGNPKGITMSKQADWLMNESGEKKSINAVNAVKAMIGPHTRLIARLARWNGQDATKVVPEALATGIALHGYTEPSK